METKPQIKIYRQPCSILALTAVLRNAVSRLKSYDVRPTKIAVAPLEYKPFVSAISIFGRQECGNQMTFAGLRVVMDERLEVGEVLIS